MAANGPRLHFRNAASYLLMEWSGRAPNLTGEWRCVRTQYASKNKTKFDHDHCQFVSATAKVRCSPWHDMSRACQIAPVRGSCTHSRHRRFNRFALRELSDHLVAPERPRREPELGHVRVPGNDALAQGLFESLNWITFPERPEQWSFRVSALTGAGGRMGAGAIPVHKSLAAPDCGRVLRAQPIH